MDLSSDPDRLYWTLGNGGLATERLRYADLPATFGASSSTDLTGQVFNISPNPGGGLRTPVIDPDANRIYWASGSDRISYANLDGTGGGTDLPTGPEAFVNSPDGLSLLKKPKPISPPSVSGTPETGSTLTCGAGTWAGDAPNAAIYRTPASSMYEWTRDGNTIAGATSATHTPDSAGEYRCKQTASNFAGSSAQTSAAVAVQTPPGPPAVPDNRIVLGKTVLNKIKGTAKIKVEVAGAGRLELTGKNVKSVGKEVDGGTETLTVKPRGKAKNKLESTGRVRVTVRITFTPTGGEPNSVSMKLTLKQK